MIVFGNKLSVVMSLAQFTMTVRFWCSSLSYWEQRLKAQTFKRDNSASNKIDLVGNEYGGQTSALVGVSSWYKRVVQTFQNLVEAVSTVNRVDEQQRITLGVHLLSLKPRDSFTRATVSRQWIIQTVTVLPTRTADFAPSACGAAADWCRHPKNAPKHEIFDSSCEHKTILHCCPRRTELPPKITCK